MRPFVKICGIRTQSDLVRISALEPQALGFVFWEKSKRFVEPQQVGAWNTPSSIRRVGVFVNPSSEELQSIAEKARLDVLQIHGSSIDWTLDRALFPKLEIWGALTPDEFLDREKRAHGFSFDRFLLDSYDPKTIGGTGKTCDWSRAKEVVEASKTPVLLAGGLTPENVCEAIQIVHPWGVDVSSGVEIAPGKKDLEKVEAFIAACSSG